MSACTRATAATMRANSSRIRRALLVTGMRRLPESRAIMPERNRFPSRRRVGIAASMVATWAVAAPAGAASAVTYWGQVQSHLEALDGAPLIAANWHGRYR